MSERRGGEKETNASEMGKERRETRKVTEEGKGIRGKWRSSKEDGEDEEA